MGNTQPDELWEMWFIQLLGYPFTRELPGILPRSQALLLFVVIVREESLGTRLARHIVTSLSLASFHRRVARHVASLNLVSLYMTICRTGLFCAIQKIPFLVG